jgi:hypothetical protein
VGRTPRNSDRPDAPGAAEDLRQRIDAANAEALTRLNEAEPVLVDVRPAREVVPGLGERMVLHSGPPVSWARMAGAQRGAVVGMLLFEGWARSPEQALAILEAGEIGLEPTHEHQAVGPMAGTVSPSLPVFVVEDQAHNTRAFCRKVDGAQQFGAYDDEALMGLRTWRDLWAPAFSRALRHGGGLRLKPLLACAIEMGDELHNRPHAATALFGVEMARRMARAGVPVAALAEAVDLCHTNPFTALALSMAAAKAVADSLRDLAYSSVVRVMARNGTEFGIKVAGLGERWFVAPAPKIEGVYLPGFSAMDAGLDMGDSAITETVGWGGCVIGGAPAILSLVGGTPAQAIRWTREMASLTVGKSPVYRMPALGLEGAPTGFDIRKIVRTGLTPVMDTGIAHKEPGRRIIGSGIVRAPLECFQKALAAFNEQYGAPADDDRVSE